MAIAGDLVMNLSANTAPLTNGLNRARQSVRTFSNDVSGSLGGAFGKLAPQIQSATYAVDDFVAGWSTGGFAGGIRGAANNIAQLGMQIGGVQGLLIGVAIGAGATIFTKIMSASMDASKSVDELQKKLADLQTTAFKPMEIQGREKTDFASAIVGKTTKQLGDRTKDIDFEMTQRDINAKGLMSNHQRFAAERAKLRDSLSTELGLEGLNSVESINNALIANKRFGAASIGNQAWSLLGFAEAGADPLNKSKHDMSEDQRKRLESLLKLTEMTQESESQMNENSKKLRELEKELATINGAASPFSSGVSELAGFMKKGVAKLGKLTASKLPKIGIPTFGPTGFAQEGVIMGTLPNQAPEEKKPLGKPSEAFSQAAEQGSMDAARIILAAMGKDRTQQIAQEQLAVQKAAVNEIKKLGVTMNTKTKTPSTIQEFSV